MNFISQINRKLAANKIRSELEKTIEICNTIKSAAVLTVDGHFIAKFETQAIPINRVSSMSSSMMSLADTMTSELSMGRCRNLILENEHGILVMMHINIELILITMTHDTNALGLLVGSTRLCADAINATLDKYQGERHV